MKGVVFYMSKVVKNVWLACGFLVIVALSEVVCYKAAVNKFEKMAQKSETNITDKIKIYLVAGSIKMAVKHKILCFTAGADRGDTAPGEARRGIQGCSGPMASSSVSVTAPRNRLPALPWTMLSAGAVCPRGVLPSM